MRSAAPSADGPIAAKASAGHHAHRGETISAWGDQDGRWLTLPRRAHSAVPELRSRRRGARSGGAPPTGPTGLLEVTRTSSARPGLLRRDAGLRRRLTEYGVHAVLLAAALVSAMVTIGIVVVLARESVSFFAEVPLGSFVSGIEWTPLTGTPSFGVLPLIGGTLVVSGIAMLVAVPLGLLAAAWLSEYAAPRTRRIVKPALEIVVGVPTVVFGYFALTFFTPTVLRDALALDVTIFNALAAGIVTGIAIAPVVATVADDAFRSVPTALREGAYALGASRRHVAFRIVAPAGFSGMIAGVSLGLAKAIGETMIVAIASGGTPRLGLDPREAYQTMTAFIAQVGQSDVSKGEIGYRSLFAVGAALFLITLGLNLLTARLVRRFREVYE